MSAEPTNIYNHPIASPILQWRLELPPEQIADSVLLAVAFFRAQHGHMPRRVWCNPKDFQDNITIDQHTITPKGGCPKGYLWVF